MRLSLRLLSFLSLLLATVLVLVAPGRSALRAGEGDLFSVAPVTLTLTDLAAAEAATAEIGSGADAGPGDYWVGPPPSRLDIFVGPFIPFEDSGLAFGRATSDEDFDVGGIFGVRYQVWINEVFRVGGEFDIAGHAVDGGAGDVLFRGHMARLFFLVPLSFEYTFGNDLPWSIGFTVAPGFQVAVPEVDDDVDFFQSVGGRFIDQDAFVGLDVRTALSVRIPIDDEIRFFIEAAYDWSWGEADVHVRNSFGQLLEERSDEIDLSALSVFFGLSVVF